MAENGDDKAKGNCKRSPSLEALRGERLAARIGELHELQEFMAADGSRNGSSGIEQAARSIDSAGAAHQRGECQAAWRHCHQAFRFLLASMSEDERESRRRALRREAEEKLKNWRREAVLDIIGQDKASEKISVAELNTAQFIMDEHFGNMYFKLEAAAIGLRAVPWIMGALTALLVVVAILVREVESGFVLFNLPDMLVVLAAGAVGATLSNTLSILGYSGRIPALLGQMGSWGMRLPLGALSAFAVVAVVQSDLLPLDGIDAPGIYGWAIAAGFSDQLLNQVMRRVEKAAEK